MARLHPETLFDLSETAWRNKANWDALLAECFEHALPDRNPYHNNGTGKPEGSGKPRGQDKTSKRVFDSTLMTDAIKLANRLQSELFPIGDEWAKLVPGPFVGDDVKEQASVELSSLQKVLFAAIQFSNFDLAISEWLLELVVAGTACMLVQRGNDEMPVVFQAVAQSHVALREGAFGLIDMVSRKHRMRHSLIRSTWSDADIGELPQNDPKKLNDPEVDLIEVTYHDMADAVWRYDVVLLDDPSPEHTAEKRRIVSREFYVCPWSIGRWSKAAGEVQGRSLVMAALPDARVLSSVKRYLLQQAALAIGGVFLVRNDGVINANSVRIFPGATIPVRTTGGSNGASVAPLQVGGETQLAQLVLQDLVTSIHKIMLNDGAPDIKDGVRTATEWLQRMKELQQSVGAPFARVLKEGVIPMLEALLQVLGDIGIIPKPESGKIKLNGGEIQVSFNSPLVQQQSLREVETMVNAAQVTTQIVGPQAAMQALGLSFKIEDIGSWVGARLGVDPKLIRSKQERSQLEQQAGAAAAAQMAPQGATPAVGGAGGVSPQQMAA